MLESGVLTPYYTTKVKLINNVNYSFKIKARNDVGFSLYSESITILAAMISDAPLNLMNVPSITTAYQIGLTWIPGLFDGGTSVIDYRVSFKEESTADYRIFVTNNTIIPFTIIVIILQHSSYNFEIGSILTSLRH